ncbi:hypothetical protein ORL59_28260 [Bacillus cereus]|uniref:hypothetical protein n=1 Tax=Bacillus cereus TaxID=1396 RepID=UPI002ABFCDAD|nr:hypothetical protein [Bacillus cereus]MDZ4417391.1 hypothetical protein [Bacillus cereus]
MNLSIQDELQPFVEELQRYITPVFLEELAREIGFIKGVFAHPPFRGMGKNTL